MSKLYFIDHESIKKTAKAIKKQNEKHNYTYILDELTKCLGYKSYNDYEHYLTNAFLNSQENLTKLIPLTKAYIPDLIELSNKTLDHLSALEIEASNVYFIDKIINEKSDILKKQSSLSFKSYLYYLPYIFGTNVSILDDKRISLLPLENLLNIMRTYYLSSPLIRCESGAYEISQDLEHLKSLATENLKIRGIYYASLSQLENIHYPESYIVNLLFTGESDAFIISEIEYQLYKDNELNLEINPLLKNSSEILDCYSLFPYIKNNITPSNPIVLGVDNEETPLFINGSDIFNNVQIFGVPGTGKGAITESIMLQIMMHNRGFLHINASAYSSGTITYDERRAKYMASLFNRKDDYFSIKSKGYSGLSELINNNKIVNFDLVGNDETLEDKRRESMSKLDKLLNDLGDYHYKSKFRKNSLPYYIIIDNYPSALSQSIINSIKKLNKIGIYIISISQTLNDYNPIFNHVIISNGSYFAYKEKMKTLFSEVPSRPWSESGPTRNGATFSHYYNSICKQQFWVRFSEDYNRYCENIKSTV